MGKREHSGSLRSIRWLYVMDAMIVSLILIVSYQVSHKVSNTEVQQLLHAKDGSAVVVEGQIVQSFEHLDILLDGRHAGELIDVTIQKHDGTSVLRAFELHPQYGTAYFIVSLLVSAVFVVLALFVIRRRYGDLSAHIFHHLCILIALLLCSNPVFNCGLPLPLSIISLVGYYLSYGLVPVLLLHFTLVFPGRAASPAFPLLRLCYSLAVVLSLALTLTAVASFFRDGHYIELYIVLLRACRLLFVLYVFLSVARLVQSYSNTTSTEERRKILWVLLGFAISVLSFAVLWLLPLIIYDDGLISEELATALTVVAPITFSVAILRYKALDIDFIVNRGTVYLIVVALLLGVYSLLLTLAVRVIGGSPTTLEFTIPVLVLLTFILFAPTRGLVQGFVDRTFFRVQYDYRNTQRLLLQKIRECVTVQSLAERVVEELDALMHAERLAFCRRGSNDSLLLLASRGMQSQNMVAADLYDPQLFIASYSCMDEDGSPEGYLCCGPKKSGQKYSDEDVDLLVMIAQLCGSMLRRTTLQEELVREQIETQRQVELNQLKSYFVSGVTHELKTPLTSIRMFAEMLQSQVSSDKARKYLHIIEGESDRLTRLINNVLNFAMLEKGVLQYHPTTVDVHDVIMHVVELLQYQIQINGFELELRLDALDTVFVTDPDALSEVLINLISNSLKYSAEDKYVCVKTTSDEKLITLSVSDHGIGIPEQERENIFEPFVRLKSVLQNRARGAGLGLALVKHYVDTQRGSIEIDSVVAQGTTIRIVLPRNSDGE